MVLRNCEVGLMDQKLDWVKSFYGFGEWEVGQINNNGAEIRLDSLRKFLMILQNGLLAK